MVYFSKYVLCDLACLYGLDVHVISPSQSATELTIGNYIINVRKTGKKKKKN
jgi:hypothetical protein